MTVRDKRKKHRIVIYLLICSMSVQFMTGLTYATEVADFPAEEEVAEATEPADEKVTEETEPTEPTEPEEAEQPADLESEIRGIAEQETAAGDYLFYLTYADIQARLVEMPDIPATNGIDREQLMNNTVYLAQNEREAFQVFYREQKEARTIRLEVSGFVNEQGEELPCAVYNEAFFTVGGTTAYADALVPYRQEEVQTEPEQNNMFYVEFHSAADQTPGSYTGQITLYAGEEILEQRTITTNVWNFALPQSRYSDAIMGLYNSMSGYENTSGFLRLNGVRFENGNVAEEDKELAKAVLLGYQEFLIGHGISTYEIPKGLIDEDPVEAELTMADPRRRSFVVPQVAVRDGKLTEESEAIINQYKEIVYDNPFLKDKALFYIFDEPNWANVEVPFDQTIAELSRVWPGGHIVSPFFGQYDKTVSKFRGTVDIFCPNQSLFTNQQTITDAASADWYKVWRYPGDNLHGGVNMFVWPVLSVGTMRRAMQWQQYLLNTDGILYWNCAYLWNNPWENMALPGGGGIQTGNGDGILLYPGAPIGEDPTTPIASLRIKQFSDGLDDYDYIRLADEFIGPDFAKTEVEKVLWGAKSGDLTKIISKEGGFNAWTCIDMARTRIELGNALSEANTEHNFGPWELAVEGDENHDGMEIRTCADCKTEESRRVEPVPEKIPVTITFDANGGEGSMEAMSAFAGTPVTLAANTFQKTGYSLRGWNTEADGSGASYTDGQEVTLEEDTILYAQWDVQNPAILVEIPAGIELQDGDDGYAKAGGQIRVAEESGDKKWWPDKNIVIRSDTITELSNGETGNVFDAQVYKADGSRYEDGGSPLMILNPLDAAGQSGSFSLEMPLDKTKPVGHYEGVLKFYIKFED